MKRSDWIQFICFKPHLDNDQMHQAAILSCEKNDIDECLRRMLGVLNVQDVQNVNHTMDSLSQIHSDKVRLAAMKADLLEEGAEGSDTFYTEGQKEFLSLFKGCFKSKADYGAAPTAAEITTKSLH